MIHRLTLTFIALGICVVALPHSGDFLNSTGKDGRFHGRPDMYLCLNFSFDPGQDIRDNARLHGELLFSGFEGHVELEKVDSCVLVTQKMVDHQNAILDALDGSPSMKPGESREFKMLPKN